jgi:hypothetical protein
MRTRSRSVSVETTRSTRAAKEKPIVTTRDASMRSAVSIVSSARRTDTASTNETPCFARFADAF